MWFTRNLREPATWNWYWTGSFPREGYSPAIDIQKSGTRREDLLLDPEELEATYIMRKALNGMKGDEAVENILNMFVHTRDNRELVARVRRQKFI